MTSIVFDQSGDSIVRLEDQIDGTRKVIFEDGSLFALIKASELNAQEAWFSYHQPATWAEYNFKQELWRTIQMGVRDFYIPRHTPTFSNDGNGIVFALGKMPALGKSLAWWNLAAARYAPFRHSRLGTEMEYKAFLGCLIKSWVEEGCPIDVAWSTVCNDSGAVSYYQNAEFWYPAPRPTGSCEHFGLCDLANVQKILAPDWLRHIYPVVSGNWMNTSYDYPLSKVEYYQNYTVANYTAAGWIVLEA